MEKQQAWQGTIGSSLLWLYFRRFVALPSVPLIPLIQILASTDAPRIADFQCLPVKSSSLRLKQLKPRRANFADKELALSLIVFEVQEHVLQARFNVINATLSDSRLLNTEPHIFPPFHHNTCTLCHAASTRSSLARSSCQHRHRRHHLSIFVLLSINPL
jgi:hypothetical protein